MVRGHLLFALGFELESTKGTPNLGPELVCVSTLSFGGILPRPGTESALLAAALQSWRRRRRVPVVGTACQRGMEIRGIGVAFNARWTGGWHHSTKKHV